jgi:hypothetical protein
MNANVQRDERMLRDHIGGASLRDLGDRFGLSHEGARQVVVRASRKHIDRLELDLMAGAKTGDWPTLLVPHQHQEDWQLMLRYLQWVLDQLRGRDVPVTVTTTNTPSGTAFQLRQEETA